MISFTQDNRQAKIETPLGKDKFLLESFSGWEGFSELFQYTAVLLSEDNSIEGDQLVGKRVSVTYNYEADGGEGERQFNGYVNRFEYLGERGDPVNMSGYEISIVPWFWFLKNNFDCEIFQEMKTPDIIKKIFDDLGYTDFEMKLSESYAEREYCVQYNESDFDFVSRLMEEEGICYYFTHTKDKHQMVITDSPSGYYQLEDSEVQYAPIGQAHAAHLTNWRHVYEFRPGKIVHKDFNFKKPTDGLLVDEKSKTKYENNSKFEVYQYPGLFYEGPDGKRLAKVRREQNDSEHDVVEGDGYYPSFSTGGKFSINEHQRSGEKGKSFVIVSVHTEITADYDFDASTKVDFRNSFRCIPSDTMYRPPRKTRKPVIDGPQTAIVVTDGQEIVVDEHARVKVQFHWDRYGKKNVKSSCWIRVSQVHAGAGWGMIDIPRKDEEVIVSFLDGDPDRPIITGRVYNGDNQPPFGLEGAGDNTKNKTRRGNTTKSYEASGYNEMTMDDTAGKEEIRIHAQYDMNTVIEHDETWTVHNNRTKKVDVNEKNTIGVDQTSMIGKNRTMTVGVNHTETIGANQTITIGANQTTTIGAAQTTTVGAAQTNIIGGAQTSVIGGAFVLAVGGAVAVAVGGESALAVGEKKEEQIADDLKQVVGGSTEINTSKNTTIQSGDKIEIKCGAASITLEKSGKITLKGTEILAQATAGKVHIMKGGIVDIKGPMVKINT